MDFQGHESMLPFDIFGGLAVLAILAGAIVLAIWAIRALPGSRFTRITPAPVETPLDTLARRFALGEISAEEFERARNLLRGDPPKP